MNVTTDILAGPFKYSPKGKLVMSRYAVDGTIALLIVDPETSAPLLTASVNIEGANLEPDEICIKDWSENEGCADALVGAGVLEETEKFFPTGYVVAGVYKIVGPLVDWLDKLPSHEEFEAA